MLVIGLRVANYIKLVSHGYVLGYKVSFKRPVLGGGLALAVASAGEWGNSMFLLDVSIE
jgi:hypothetical protein